MNLSTFKKTSDKVLHTYVKKKIQWAQKIATRDRPKELVSYIEDYIFAWWKRLRPYLIYLWYKLYGGSQDAEVIRFSRASELIHTFALIHDDIIDKWEMRHWVKCVHTYATDIINKENKVHLWQSQAILLGDMIYSWAYDALFEDYALPSKELHNAQKYMQEMIEEVVVGQMLDVDTMCWDHVTTAQLEEKNHYKSWQYTFSRPLVTGAILAWVDKKNIAKLEKIGALLGKAYQMRDDILDVTFAEGDDTTYYDNKTKFSDIQDGQQTYLTNYIYEKWSYTHRAILTKAMWKRLTKTHIDDLRKVFIASGAIEYGKGLLVGYLDEATAQIDKLVVKNIEYKKYMYDLIGILSKL
jgi:geranylgeranyl diphosphate synthase, type I